MNIALLINSLNFGGAERIFADLSVALSKKGHNIFIFLMNDRDIAYDYAGKTVKIGMLYKKSGKLMALISWQHILGTAIAKRKYKIDVTISAMEYLNLINILTGKDKKISTLHNYRFQNEVTPNAKDNFIENMFIKYAKKNSAIVCVSKNIENKAKNIYKNVPVKTIYNSFNIKQIEAESLKKPENEDYIFNKKTFINVGRLTFQKNQKRLIEAFRIVHEKHREAQLLIVGGGEDEETLKQLCEQYGISENVHFTGFTTHPFYYMKNSTVFVLSSDYEGFGNVIIESLACGTPVISTDCKCGPREILAPDSDITKSTEKMEICEYGILTALTAESLAEGMLRMIEDDELREKYSEKALKRALDFQIDRQIDEWTELLDNIKK